MKDWETQRLEQRCQEGISQRYTEALRPWAFSQLARELGIIDQLKQAGEFLLVGSVFQFAQAESIPCKLIGAACGSMVCYLLGVTDVEPLQHQLVFERFRDLEGRRTVPFSVRVDGRQKDRLIRFAESLSGRRNLGEVLNLSELGVTERIPQQLAALIRCRRTREFTLHGITCNDNSAFAVLRGQDCQGIYQFEQADLRGFLRQSSPGDVGDIAAVMALDGATIDRPELAEQYINGDASLRYPGEVRSDVVQLLHDTRGMILYQEQVMLLLHWFADVELPDGYAITKAAAAGKSEKLADNRVCFCANAFRNGLDEKTAKELFDEIVAAAEYTCCKSHQLAEAMTTYQAAFLKAHYPSEFQEVLESTTTRE